ncbi:glycine betaine ABC transporter substrate-binding protein [Fusibacillus kribbianus]|uniref:Glycine betaine ABC transporter substrate-binding protein n=1 Tax=Fusibacillus kribbianus TaxID=3044208 RepID=A0AAP4F0F3_9FIRM|nr:glycine betaine ABC transporter substrate-binding protein [Ruminococcus sp. YH-rum2234]MDI9241768.1 glycine betaine ABC transporter substrate-binding protein [Ruminococcus sp. YH-rum2234]
MKKWKSSTIIFMICVLALSGLCGCGSKKENTVTVIDGDFAEMKLFTQVARIMIEEKTELSVKVQDSMASSLAFEQIKSGKMDIYMSYDGSLLTAYLGKDPSEVPAGTSLYDYANELGKTEANVMLTPKLGGQNTYVVAVSQETAAKYQLSKVSDLTACASSLTFAAEHEFFDEGSKHFDSFVDFYGISFKESNTIDRGLKYAGMDSKNMDVTIVYSTDGLNKKFNLVTLEDDKKFFPEYNGAYLVRADLYKDHPELEEVFASLAGVFTDEVCTELNYKIDVENQDPYDVAHEFLKEKGFL